MGDCLSIQFYIISNYKAKMRKLRLYSLELEEKGDMQQ